MVAVRSVSGRRLVISQQCHLPRLGCGRAAETLSRDPSLHRGQAFHNLDYCVLAVGIVRMAAQKETWRPFLSNTMNTIFVVLLTLIPASFSSEPFPARVAQANEVSINELRKAPAKVVLDGRSLSLSAYVWRDFMPSVQSMIDGKPMIAVFKVATSDKKSFPSGIRIERAWVLFGEQMWETSDFREQIGGPANNKDSSEKWINCSDATVCEAVARGGPKWGPGVFVDVVVRLSDREGRQHLLQAPKQYVQRTH
jgi:hypothetical protein